MKHSTFTVAMGTGLVFYAVHLAHAAAPPATNYTPLVAPEVNGGYDLSWFTIDSGGAIGASGGSYELSGTIGQSDAGGQAGGSYTLDGGFWAGSRLTASECTTVQTVNPLNCSVDPRQPHALTNTVLAQGIDQISFAFASPCDASSIQAGDFSLQVVPGPIGGLAVSTVQGSGTSATVLFNHSIPTGQWTCLTHFASGEQHCLGFLPGEMDGNRVVNSLDVSALAAMIALPNPSLMATDINRSGGTNSEDLTALVNLLNGAGLFQPWLGASLPSCPSFP